MEKIRPRRKNENWDEYFDLLKAKLDEIVEFLGLLPIVPPLGEDEEQGRAFESRNGRQMGKEKDTT